MAEPVSLDILSGEQVAIVGPNGAGKSRLTDIIAGKFPLLGEGVRYDFSPSPLTLASDNIRRITFRDAYGDATQTYYLQQRWNQHDIDPATPTVKMLLDAAWETVERSAVLGMDARRQEAAHRRRTTLRETLCQLFDIDGMADKYVISLSSGELRKFQLTVALLSAPRILILDNPFVGLDAETRQQLRQLLQTLIDSTDLQVILELSRDDEIPDFITHVIPVAEGLHVQPKMTLPDYRSMMAAKVSMPQTGDVEAAVLALPEKDLGAMPFYTPGAPVIDCRNVSIRYGRRTILDGVSWTVGEGECWALTGRNGSGKSTLLSLICADNPQGYACDITLFGHRRGSGESIWEIKHHIGYVSPEMHRAYLKDIPAIDIVASGLRDSIGLYGRIHPEEREACMAWMCIFGIQALADRTFLTLSSGEQRLCLLARAFVKDPELLILDEPLHGLDTSHRHIVRAIIDAFSRRQHKTIIVVTHYADELPHCIRPGMTRHLT